MRGTQAVPPVRIAHDRSGDKGADVNIRIVARDPVFLPLVADQLSADAVGQWLSRLGATDVRRFALPGIDAVNFS